MPGTPDGVHSQRRYEMGYAGKLPMGTFSARRVAIWAISDRGYLSAIPAISGAVSHTAKISARTLPNCNRLYPVDLPRRFWTPSTFARSEATIVGGGSPLRSERVAGALPPAPLFLGVLLYGCEFDIARACSASAASSWLISCRSAH